MNFNNSITNTFIQSSIVFRNILEKNLADLNLHSGQVFILISLWENDGQSQNDLAKRLNVSSPTITKMVKSLLRTDYIKCVNCRKDGRVVRVFLTPKGYEIKAGIEKIWSDIEGIFLQNFTEPEKMILQQLMEKTFNNLLSLK